MDTWKEDPDQGSYSDRIISVDGGDEEEIDAIIYEERSELSSAEIRVEADQVVFQPRNAALRYNQNGEYRVPVQSDLEEYKEMAEQDEEKLFAEFRGLLHLVEDKRKDGKIPSENDIKDYFEEESDFTGKDLDSAETASTAS